MLSESATPDEYRAELKALNKPFMETGCIDCLDCETLIRGWLAGDVKTADACRHIQGCPTSQARLQQAHEYLTAITAGPPAREANQTQTQTLKGGSASPWQGETLPQLAAERLIVPNMVLEGVEV